MKTKTIKPISIHFFVYELNVKGKEINFITMKGIENAVPIAIKKHENRCPKFVYCV